MNPMSNPKPRRESLIHVIISNHFQYILFYDMAAIVSEECLLNGCYRTYSLLISVFAFHHNKGIDFRTVQEIVIIIICTSLILADQSCRAIKLRLNPIRYLVCVYGLYLSALSCVVEAMSWSDSNLWISQSRPSGIKRARWLDNHASQSTSEVKRVWSYIS
jgi:hypothetical protein